MRALILAACLLVAPAAAAGGTPAGVHVTLDLHASLLTDSASEPLVNATLGYGLQAGYRWGQLGLYLHAEHNAWLAIEHSQGLELGAFNLGLGGELLFADGWVRTAVAFGPSILLHQTLFDAPGTVGVFLDVRPLGVRWCITERLTLGLDPLTFSIVAPVLGGIPLIRVLYRTHLVATWRF